MICLLAPAREPSDSPFPFANALKSARKNCREVSRFRLEARGVFCGVQDIEISHLAVGRQFILSRSERGAGEEGEVTETGSERGARNDVAEEVHAEHDARNRDAARSKQQRAF